MPCWTSHDLRPVWVIARQHALDRLPFKLSLAGEVLSRLFRRLMLEMLLAAHAAGRLQFFGDYATSPARPRSSLSRAAASDQVVRL